MNRLLLPALFLSSIFLPPSSLFSQGSLTPPGAPAATMKTIDQLDAKLERRTPVSGLSTINTSGSYYLTGNIAVTSGNVVTITADNVMLDLNGFTISSTASPASGTAITISGVRRNITIRNGFIRGTTTFAAGAFTTGGFTNGILGNNASSANLRVSEVSVYGLAGDGINLGNSSVASFFVERCVVSVCADLGILGGTVRDCIAETIGSSAIQSDSAVNCTGDTVSITAGSLGVSGLSVIQNCIGTSVSGPALQGQQVSNSFGTSSSGNGINATNAINSQGVTTTGTNGIAIASGGSATFCRGRRDGGVAISAPTGNVIGCEVLSSGTVTAQGKFLGTP